MMKSICILGLALAVSTVMQVLASAKLSAAIITFADPAQTIASGIQDLNVVGFGHYNVVFNSVDSFNTIFGSGSPPPVMPTFFGNMPGAIAAAEAIGSLLSSGNAQVPEYTIRGVGVSRPTISTMVPVAFLTDINDPPAVQSAEVLQDNPNAFDPPKFVWDYRGFVGVKPEVQGGGSYAVFTPTANVPEPSSLFSFVGLTLFGLCTLCRRRQPPA